MVVVGVSKKRALVTVLSEGGQIKSLGGRFVWKGNGWLEETMVLYVFTR